MKTLEEGYAKGWADAIYAYESKQRMSSPHLPLPEPRHCCGDRLLPCKKCGADVWSDGEDEYGNLSDGGSYERFKCGHCGNVIYVQLPD